jgi:hypothetical protein
MAKGTPKLTCHSLILPVLVENITAISNIMKIHFKQGIFDAYLQELRAYKAQHLS